MIFAVLNLGGVEPVKDAATKANNLFLEKLTRGSYSMAFDAARRALEQLRLENLEDKEDVIAIPQGYLNLENVVENMKRRTVDCTDADVMDQFYELHKLMSTHTTNDRSSPNDFQLGSNFIEVKRAYLFQCGARLSKELSDMAESDEKIDGMKLSDAFELMKVFRYFWYEDAKTQIPIHELLSGQYKPNIRDQYRSDNLHNKLGIRAMWDTMTTIDFASLLHEKAVSVRLFEISCGIVERAESYVKLINTFLKMLEMIDRPRGVLYPEERLAVDYLVCQEARKVYLDRELDIPKFKVLP